MSCILSIGFVTILIIIIIVDTVINLDKSRRPQSSDGNLVV